MQQTVLLSAIVAASLVVLALFGGVNDEDIAKCQAATNYSAERCIHEIMR